jgi:hypothetical protein
MPTPVQITVTVDPSESVQAIGQIGNAGQKMGEQISAAGLKGAEAVAALTAQWEAEQKAIAETTAQLKEQQAAQRDVEAAARKSAQAFQGITNDQTKASIAGRLFGAQLGSNNRALNQVISRSQILGPLMAGLFNVAIFDAGAQAILRIGQGIIKITSDMAGYTEEVKQSYAESVKASQAAFLNPQSLEIARAHTAEINRQSEMLEKVASAEVSRSQVLMAQDSLQGTIAGFLFYDLANIASQGDMTKKQIALDDQRRQLLEKQTELVQQMNDEARRGAEANALIGLTGIAKIQQQYKNTIEEINSRSPLVRNSSASNQDRANAEKKMDLEIGEIQKQAAEETMQIYDQVFANRLQGIAKIKFEEQAQLKDEEAALAKKLGMSESEVESTALFQAKRLQITESANNKIGALNLRAEEQTEALEKRARDAQLTGDDLILANKQDSLDAVVKAYANNEISVQQYYRRIVAIDAAANAEITKNDQTAAEKKKNILDRSAEDIKDANDAMALASVAPWQRTYEQIVIESERRLAAIDQQERQARLQYKGDQDEIVAVTASAQAKRGAVWAEENQKIREENQRLTEQLGSDLQSIFDDIGSGNIGQRILKNMEKLFFEIIARWILTTQTMQSSFGRIFGTLLGGPGSTAENVSGGGLSSLFGLTGSTSSFASFGAGAPASGSGAAAVNLGGLFGASSGGSAAGSSSSGSGSFDFGGLFPPGTSDSQSVPGASGGGANGSLTTTAISALGGGQGPGAITVGSGGGGGLFGAAGKTQSGIAAVLGLAAMLGGSKLGVSGQIGGTALGLLLTGKLGGLGSALYGSLQGLGLSTTAIGAISGAIFGGGIGGTLGFGVGSQFGKVPGALSGAGSGALTGFIVGGPLGAAIGGLIGLLGGLFGGFFGDSKRKKQANAYFDSQVGPAITKIEDDFKGFSIDYSSAIGELESLRTQSQSQLKALKGQGNDVFNKKVSPAIDAAEAVVNQYETERLRRSGLVFGPPQFHDGGYVNALQSYQRPGELMALLKHGEFVMNPRATSSIGVDRLHAMNSGAGIGGMNLGGIHLYPQTLDRAYVNSPMGLEKDLLQKFNQWRREGKM